MMTLQVSWGIFAMTYVSVLMMAYAMCLKGQAVYLLILE